jgi:down-regulator of transcription 1
MADIDDQSLPKATINKMISDLTPQGIRISQDLRDLLCEGCTEFVLSISSEANDISTKENKTTITPEHVLRALKQLGFDEFIEQCTKEMEIEKDVQKVKRVDKKKKKDIGMTQEEAMAMQQKMFADAKARMAGSKMDDGQHEEEQEQEQGGGSSAPVL